MLLLYKKSCEEGKRGSSKKTYTVPVTKWCISHTCYRYCRLLNCLAASYRKFGHMGKLACGAIRVMKTAEIRKLQPGLDLAIWIGEASRACSFFLVWPNFR